MYSVSMAEPSKCDRLGGCIHVCPEEVWQWSNIEGIDLPVPVNQEKCVGCMKCVNICPPKIIEVVKV